MVELFSSQSTSLWKVYISGPKGTPYEGGLFILKLDMTDNYPFKSPKVLIIIGKIYYKNLSSKCKARYRRNL